MCVIVMILLKKYWMMGVGFWIVFGVAPVYATPGELPALSPNHTFSVCIPGFEALLVTLRDDLNATGLRYGLETGVTKDNPEALPLGDAVDYALLLNSRSAEGRLQGLKIVDSILSCLNGADGAAGAALQSLATLRADCFAE